MIANLLEEKSAGDAASRAIAECAAGPIMNLVISFPIELPTSTGDFLANYMEQARQWQAPVRPQSFHFSHGEYMNLHGNPISYLVGELKSKPTSNRACISLVDSHAIMASGDGKLPSFMLVQVGFQGISRDRLYLSAYYRALEVSTFLPINMAEMAIIAERISEQIPSIERVDVTMHAFRAHVLKDYRAHRRSQIDICTPQQIHELVSNRNLRELAMMLTEKSTPESIIEDSGLTVLRMEVEHSGWSVKLLDELDRAISALIRLRTSRESGTHEASIEKLQKELTFHLVQSASLIKLEQER